MTPQWPDWLIELVRAVKRSLGFFSDRSVLGVPLDLPVRFLVIGGFYLMLQWRLSRRAAAVDCLESIATLLEQLAVFWLPGQILLLQRIIEKVKDFLRAIARHDVLKSVLENALHVSLGHRPGVKQTGMMAKFRRQHAPARLRIDVALPV